MERNIIESMSASLPLSALGEVQTDVEIWEETDGAAHFKVTRHHIPTTAREAIFMSVSGPANERARVAQEFSEVFGEAIDATQEPEADFYAWLLPEHD